MCAVLDAQVIQHGGGVVGHVLERVDRRAGPAKERTHHAGVLRALHAPAVELAGQADVAVVVSDDPQPVLHQLFAEPVAPQQQLRARDP